MSDKPHAISSAAGNVQSNNASTTRPMACPILHSASSSSISHGTGEKAQSASKFKYPFDQENERCERWKCLDDWERKEIELIATAFLSQPHISLDLDPLSRPRSWLIGTVLGCFEALGVDQCFGVGRKELIPLLEDVDRGYMSNPYHNFTHAVDVTMFCYLVLTQTRAIDYLTQLETSSLMLGAIMHDIGHPGKSNLFQVHAKTSIAAEYGPRSTLELYSADLAVALMYHHGLMRSIPRPQRWDYAEEQPSDASERVVRGAILSTDMSLHYHLVKELADLVDSESFSMPEEGARNDSPGISGKVPLVGLASGDRDRREEAMVLAVEDQAERQSHEGFVALKSRAHQQRHAESSGICDSEEPKAEDLTPCQRLTIVRTILHVADISNTVRPWRLCKSWSDLVLCEFFAQGDVEKRMGLEVSPNMDREKGRQGVISVDFGDIIVRPFLDLVCEIVPECEGFLDVLERNRGEWIRLEKGGGQQGYTSLPTTPNGRIMLEKSKLELGPAAAPATKLLSTTLKPPPSRRVSVAAGTVVIPDVTLLSPIAPNDRQSSEEDMTIERISNLGAAGSRRDALNRLSGVFASSEMSATSSYQNNCAGAGTALQLHAAATADQCIPHNSVCTAGLVPPVDPLPARSSRESTASGSRRPSSRRFSVDMHAGHRAYAYTRADKPNRRRRLKDHYRRTVASDSGISRRNNPNPNGLSAATTNKTPTVLKAAGAPETLDTVTNRPGWSVPGVVFVPERGVIDVERPNSLLATSAMIRSKSLPHDRASRASCFGGLHASASQSLSYPGPSSTSGVICTGSGNSSDAESLCSRRRSNRGVDGRGNGLVESAEKPPSVLDPPDPQQKARLSPQPPGWQTRPKNSGRRWSQAGLEPPRPLLRRHAPQLWYSSRLIPTTAPTARSNHTLAVHMLTPIPTHHTVATAAPCAYDTPQARVAANITSTPPGSMFDLTRQQRRSLRWSLGSIDEPIEYQKLIKPSASLSVSTPSSIHRELTRTTADTRARRMWGSGVVGSNGDQRPKVEETLGAVGTSNVKMSATTPSNAPLSPKCYSRPRHRVRPRSCPSVQYLSSSSNGIP